MNISKVHIHPSRPYADGILFDDLYGLTFEEQNRLASRGVVFCTDFKNEGRHYGGNIIARSWEEAEDIAFSRGLGEEVIGVFVKAGVAR